MTLESQVIGAIEAFTPLSVQTSGQAGAQQNTKAKLLYSSATRRQGNFTLYFQQAQRDLVALLKASGRTLDEADMPRALALLVWDYGIKKFPEWDAQSYSPGGSESVTRARPGITSAMAALEDMIDKAPKVKITAPSPGKIADAENYPDLLKPTNLNVSLQGW